MKRDKLKNNVFNELVDMVIEKMTEYGIQKQRENVPEIDILIKEKTVISIDVKKILDKIDEDSRQTLLQFYEQSEKIADMQIEYLYLQGAKDCIQLLKKLGVL